MALDRGETTPIKHDLREERQEACQQPATGARTNMSLVQI